MRTETPQPVRLEDYRPPAFLVDDITLDVALDPDRTVVRSVLSVRRNRAGEPLRLDGEAIELLSVRVDGAALSPQDYVLDNASLTIPDAPDVFTLEVETVFSPRENTALSGIYLSNERIFSQCEAEGFRRITYFPDRPDVLARYIVRIEGDKARFPILLSNGNLAGSGDLPDGRHWAEWRDPFPKPCYLFALVGGTFDCLMGEHTTASGRTIPLRLYVDPGDASRAAYALDSLQRAMAWDERAFGREYDLDLFMIVAVRDFNFGAMENKGLNIFNSSLLLADPETATDADYEAIESVVGHEYFHNWTGNRITCRDWFQLCLKEGLTVFRDQEFSADQRGRALARIKQVRQLRARQFPEDQGPLAHPVRPSSYLKIDNFYTATVYEKGAEVIRMLNEILGPEDFRAGMDLYFERLDGQAATVEQFIACFVDASGRDLSQFMTWYKQAGTPQVKAEAAWDADAGELTLTLAQSTPPTPGQPDKTALQIPVRLGLLGDSGAPLPVRLHGENTAEAQLERTVVLTEAEQSWRFVGLASQPTASLFRNFSAPIILDAPTDAAARARVATSDSDWFNRWEAGQIGLRSALVKLARGEAKRPEPGVIASLAEALRGESLDPGFAAQALWVPDEVELAQHLDPFDPDVARAARRAVRRLAAESLRSELEGAYARLSAAGPYSPDADSAGRRALKNACLGLLAELGPDIGGVLSERQLLGADNLTDRLAAVSALDLSGSPALDEALESLYARWRNQPLALDKWFAVQARTTRPDALNRVARLLVHPDFDRRTPNRIRAVLGVFAVMNPVAFHDAAGEGHRLFTDQVLEVDRRNPALAARLFGAFEIWPRLETTRRASAKRSLQRVRDADGVSKNLYEIATRALEAPSAEAPGD
jgi:aminopeptidase N